MTPFVPDDFEVPQRLDHPAFRLEPLGPEHNDRDYAAWTSSIDHIKTTPGFAGWDWPAPMSVDENFSDMEMHERHFAERSGFTYSVLDGDEVVGCVYIYPSDAADAEVRSWVRASRADLDEPLWRAVTDWLSLAWPFGSVKYAART